jgi:alpha-amylase/alpha-mannosidase (GH57 family)
VRALVLHGHFYQPPREHPWLGVVEPERSAAPHRDWNTRITAECYRPNAAARVLDGGRLRAVVSNYEWTSFNFGPTLLAWLATQAPDVVEALRAADAASRRRTGWGNAWAQAFGHPILPLSTPRDVRTQVLWGRRDFEHRFGRAPDGMWLPEMAVDRVALETLADAGITLTMLSAHQARRVRPLGAGADAWRPVTAETLDTRRLYRVVLDERRTIDVVFRDEALSRDVAFGALLGDGATLACRLADAVHALDGPGLVALAVDGETYGHHHRFGEMALAFALRALAREGDVILAGPAAFRAEHPPADEVEIAEATSWSCAHGVERWRAGCGCRVGGPPDWSQDWRGPLRTAIDWLRDELATLYAGRGEDVFRDPWGARDRWIECMLEAGRTDAWLAAEARRSPAQAGALEARRLLELARNGLLMQTSCGWFFDELTGIEPVQVLRYAARAIELAEALGMRCEPGFLERLAPARSNVTRETGADVYRRAARGAAATPARVAATAATLRVLGLAPDVPAHAVELPADGGTGRIAGNATVVEQTTGALATVAVEAARDADGGVACRVAGVPFGVAQLFGVQKERVLDALASDAGERALRGIEGVRAVVEPIMSSALDDAGVLPPVLAALVGWEGARKIAAGIDDGRRLGELVETATTLRRRGAILPSGWLGPRLARAIEARLARLPAGAADAVALLDVARAGGVRVDLGPAQVRLLRWWDAVRPAPRPGDPLALLRERLAIAPEERP